MVGWVLPAVCLIASNPNESSEAPAKTDQAVVRHSPIEMQADGGLTVDVKNRRGRAEGNVVIRGSGLTVCCDRAEAVYGAGRLTSVSCQGRVVIRRGDGVRVTASQADFQAVQNRLVLTGGASVWRPDGRLVGARIEYDLTTDRLVVTGPGSTFRFDPSLRIPPLDRPCPAPASRPAP